MPSMVCESTLCESALGEIDALVVVGDATADDAQVRRLDLCEQRILIGNAGAHGIDHVHPDNHLLRMRWRTPWR